ncbi:MAG: phosphate/phosphite/phosphonate ABC transporter substrate-binding protein [Magnetospirillum sp.]|nr:phosphate/phosphite/phosphonate ABC transporter substrate-binding protein [Magnetospirillum sp.]
MTFIQVRLGVIAVAMLASVGPFVSREAAAQDTCSNRGQLDTLYCDANNDLVADLPATNRQRDPSTMIFAYTPVEDPAVYANIFKPLMDYLGTCTSKRWVYFPVQSNSAQIEAMRSGRLHVAGFSTGPTGFAVNIAGAVPFAAKGSNEGVRGYHLLAIVKADSPFQKLADLKGRKVAHTSPSSNSGNLAPRALFPAEGLTPGTDYQPIMSGGHDRSVLGVNTGDYDMGAVASDVFDRMGNRGTVKADNFRIIYKSTVFPTSSFAHAHDLAPTLAAKVKQCFYDFKFPAEMVKEFNGDDRFLPITYLKDWAPVREVAEKTNTPYNRAAYDAEARREAEAAARRAAPPAAAPAPAAPAPAAPRP